MATKTKKPKKTTTKPASQSQTWANQAALETLVRYRPQESVLEQAYNDAQSTYKSKVDAAKAFNALQQASIAQQAPVVDQRYTAGAQAQGAVNSLINDQLGKLQGGNSDVFKTAAMLGAGTAASNLIGDQARARASFGQQATQATEGATAQSNSAHDSLVSDVGKILAQRSDLADQEGAFSSLTYSQLHDAASKLLHDTNIHKADNTSAEKIAAGHDTTSITTAGISAAAKGKGNKSSTGVKLLTGGEHVTLRDAYDQAIAFINDHPVTQAQKQAAISHLTSGVKGDAGQQIYDPKTGKKAIDPKTGLAQTTAAGTTIPKVGGLAARAAVEQAVDGHISRSTQKKLADAGYSIRKLGLTTYADWKKHGKQPGKSSTSAAISGVTAALGKLTGTK